MIEVFVVVSLVCRALLFPFVCWPCGSAKSEWGHACLFDSVPSVGWEASVCSRFPTLVLSVIQRGALLTAILTAAFRLRGFSSRGYSCHEDYNGWICPETNDMADWVLPINSLAVYAWNNPDVLLTQRTFSFNPNVPVTVNEMPMLAMSAARLGQDRFIPIKEDPFALMGGHANGSASVSWRLFLFAFLCHGSCLWTGRSNNVFCKTFYVFGINQPSLPTPFFYYSVLVSVSFFVALSIVFYSINCPDISPLSHSVLPVSLCGWLASKYQLTI